MQFFSRTARMFPPPQYLAMSGAGIDIGSHSVKSMVLAQQRAGCVLQSYRETPLAEGVVVDGDIEQPDKMVELLRSLRLRERIRFAHASLSERKAYLYQTWVPSSERNLRAAVEFSLESHVPIPPNDVVFDFEVVQRDGEGTHVSVTAYAKRVIELYQQVFNDAGITLRSLEVESQALGRAVLSPEDKKHTTMVVDFGKKTTRIAIFEHGVVGFTVTVDVGGETLTTAVMKHFNVDADEAEKIKNTRGFLEGGENRELYETLMATISVFKDEVERHVTYWDSSYEKEFTSHPVESIILVGGNANLKGLPEYLSRSLNVPVRVGNVWTNAFSFDRYVPALPHTTSLEYAATVGLALRSCNNKNFL
ncbi:MAG: type IV pilus assembly protein PilM [Patescibacteria group bacterium UBA2163]